MKSLAIECRQCSELSNVANVFAIFSYSCVLLYLTPLIKLAIPSRSKSHQDESKTPNNFRVKKLSGHKVTVIEFG